MMREFLPEENIEQQPNAGPQSAPGAPSTPSSSDMRIRPLDFIFSVSTLLLFVTSIGTASYRWGFQTNADGSNTPWIIGSATTGAASLLSLLITILLRHYPHSRQYNQPESTITGTEVGKNDPRAQEQNEPLLPSFARNPNSQFGNSMNQSQPPITGEEQVQRRWCNVL